MFRLPPGADDPNVRALSPSCASLEARAFTLPSTEVLEREPSPPSGQVQLAGKASAFRNGLRRHRLLALTAAIVCAAVAGGLAWYKIQPKYKAFALLRVAREQPRLIFSVSDSTINAEAEFEDYKRAQRSLVTSNLVLNAALKDSRIAGLEFLQDTDPVAYLEGGLSADFSISKNVMRISMQGSDAAAVAEIVNAVSNAYLQEVVDSERSRRMDRLTKLEKIYSETDKKVRDKQVDLRKLAESLGTADKETLTIKQQNALQHSAALRTEYARIQSELIRVQGDVSSREAILKQEGDEFMDESLDEYVDQMPEIEEQRKELIKLELELNEVQLVAANNADHPLLSRYRRDLDLARRSLEAKRIALRPIARDRLRQRAHAKARTELVTLQAQAVMLKDSEQRLRKEVERFYKEAEEIGRSSIEVEGRQAEITHIEKAADNVGSEIENVRVELRSPSRVVLLQAAEVPRHKDTRLQRGATGLAALFGFVFPIFAICWWDSRGQRVNSAREVAQSVGLRVIGSVPHASDRERRLVGQRPHRSMRLNLLRESLDTIRTLILNGSGADPVRIVLITSATEGEGKTTTATQLATSFARAGRKTLLLDFDLRRPAVHRVFSMSNGSGLSELLRGEATLADIIRPTAISNLSIISAGRCDDAALFGLSQSKSLLRHFEELRANYDFVIVDCTPVLPVADCMLVAQNVDAVVFSVLRDVSRVPAIYAARQRLSSLGIRVLGAVVTGTSWDACYSDRYSGASW